MSDRNDHTRFSGHLPLVRAADNWRRWHRDDLAEFVAEAVRAYGQAVREAELKARREATR